MITFKPLGQSAMKGRESNALKSVCQDQNRNILIRYDLNAQMLSLVVAESDL